MGIREYAKYDECLDDYSICKRHYNEIIANNSFFEKMITLVLNQRKKLKLTINEKDKDQDQGQNHQNLLLK